MLVKLLTDIVRDLFKTLTGLAIPVGLVLLGGALIGLSIKFEMIVLLWIGGITALVGLLWGIVMLIWYSGG